MLILFAGKNLQESYFKSEKTMYYYHQTTPTLDILGPLGSWKLNFVVKFNA